MSQQEFRPEFQRQQQETIQNQEGPYRAKAYNYNQRRKSDTPKQDHPSAYDETVPPYSYQAQNHAPKQSPKQSQSSSQRSWDTYVPNWARPQYHPRKKFSWAKFIIIALLLLFAIPLLLKLLLFLFVLFAALMFGLIILLMVLLVGFIYIKSNSRSRWW